MPTEIQVEKMLSSTESSPRTNASMFTDKIHPGRWTIGGASASGKSRAFIKFLCTYGCGATGYGSGLYDIVIWCCPTRSLNQGSMTVLKNIWKEFLYIVPCDNGQLDVLKLQQLIQTSRDNKYETMVVFDDLLNLHKHPFITDLYVSGRHDRCSVATIGQSLFVGARTARINSTIFWVFALGERRQFAELADRLTSNRERGDLLKKAYESIISRNDYGSIFINLACKSTPEIPLRTRDSALNKLIPQLWKL